MQSIRGVIRLPNGTVVGFLEGDTFVKIVWGSRHKLRTPEAWAIDADIFDKIIRPACSAIVVEDRETFKRYYSTIANFLAERGEITRKAGRQYFMILSKWRLEI